MEDLRKFLRERGAERVVEYPFLLRNLNRCESILDVGCLESPLDVCLAKEGYFVVGTDLRKPWHEVENFVRCDARFLPFKEKAFDVSIAISTLEHIGLIAYGFEHWKGYKIDEKGDRKALDEMARVSKRMIITLPFGKGDFYWQRIYDEETLECLLNGYKVKVKEFYKLDENGWVSCSPNDVPESVRCVRGLVCLLLITDSPPSVVSLNPGN